MIMIIIKIMMILIMILIIVIMMILMIFTFEDSLTVGFVSYQNLFQVHYKTENAGKFIIIQAY